MKKNIIYLFLLPLLLLGCAKQATQSLLTPKVVGARAFSVDGIPSFFANGADVSFLSSMEAAGKTFYSRKTGLPEDCLLIMKEQGINSIRLRLWLHPQGGFCTTPDMVAMAQRVKALGFHFLLDFHYSDTWADSGTQAIPAAWKGDTFPQLLTDLYNYTYHVMDTLKSVGVTPDWVQVGNEIDPGMLGDSASISKPARLAQVINQGYAAIKAVSPSTQVVIHISTAENDGSSRSFFDKITTNGANFDIIGFSYYPAQGSPKKHYTSPIPDSAANPGMTTTLSDMVSRYHKKVMIVETGMPWTDSLNTFNGLNDCINRISTVSGSSGLGIFYWEPEAFTSWSKLTQNAFDDTHPEKKPTHAMDAFLYNPANNLLTNADFEDGGIQSGTINGWVVSTDNNNDAVYTTTGGYTRTYRLAHYKTTAYHANTYQDLTGVPNGTYILTAWIQCSGGQTTCEMYAKGGGTETDYAIPATGSVWKQITINNIQVTDGTVGVGFRSVANAGNWCHMDNVHLQLQ